MFASWPSARALQPHPCVEDLPRYRLHRQLPRHFTASFAFARALPALLLSFFLGLGIWLVEVHRGTVMQVAVGGPQLQSAEIRDHAGLREFRTCKQARLCTLYRCAVVEAVTDERPVASRCAVAWRHLAADNFHRALADSRPARSSSCPKSSIAAELISLLSPTSRSWDLTPNAISSFASSRRPAAMPGVFVALPG